MKMNCVCETFSFDHRPIALGVGIVQQGIDLVKTCRTAPVELKHGEYQCDGGERFLASGEQVDAAVLLARRLRHDLHARIESRHR